MSALCISLFGRFDAQSRGEVILHMETSKVQELFSYLLLHRDRSHARETLAGILWGQATTAQSRKYLRQALWQLQSALRAHAGQSDAGILVIEPDWIRLNTQANLWLDVMEFDRAFASVKGIPGHELDAGQARTLQDVVDLYHGDLLEGWYHDWCLVERTRLQMIYTIMLDKLMAYSEARNDFEAGITYGVRILQCDRAHERAHRRLMRLYCLAGDRTAALRQYQRCADALDVELGVKPGQSTENLLRHISADDFTGLARVTDDIVPDRDQAETMPGILSHLRQLQAIVGDVERQIRDDIVKLERLLHDPR